MPSTAYICVTWRAGGGGALWLGMTLDIRGVQILSETAQIRSDFGTKISISDRIDKVVS